MTNNQLHYSAAQMPMIERRDKMSQEIANLSHLRDLMESSGHKDDAKHNITPKINKLIKDRDDLERLIHEDSRRGSKALLMTLVGCDYMTEMADYFGETINDISCGHEPVDNALSRRCRELAEEFNRLVCKIDGMNDALSMFYSDLSEDAVNTAKESIGAVIDKWMDTKKGLQYF